MFILSYVLTVVAAAIIAQASALPRSAVLVERAPSSSGGSPSQTGGQSSPSSTSLQQAVYWGQGSADKPLSNYCSDSEGIDVLILAFISSYSNGQMSGTLGNQCSVTEDCTDLAQQVQQCQSSKKKILVSLGGASSAVSLTSQTDAETLAQDLWDSFGNPALAQNKQAPRPLGQQIVDGFDLDIESNDSTQNVNYKYLVNKLRQLFQADSSKQYYISGAPQCPFDDGKIYYMDDMIMNSQFDWLFVQFYNNAGCSANNTAGFNLDQWSQYIGGGASKSAQLFIGLVASTTAATGTDTGAGYYLQPSAMAQLVNQYKSKDQCGGVMLWEAGDSDSLNQNGCTYTGEVASVLQKGTTC